MLTEYECGRAQVAIESVARSEKPITEIGGRLVKDCDLLALARDLNLCVRLSGESVRAFIAPDRMAGFCCYGFYRYPWAMQAFLSVWQSGVRLRPSPQLSIWIQGLLFGYGPCAVQSFISSASFGRVSKSRRYRDKHTVRRYRVEIYGSLVQHVLRRNNRNDRSRKHC